MKTKTDIEYYILKGKRVYKCDDLEKWSKWWSDNAENRIIKTDYLLNGYVLLTLFVGTKLSTDKESSLFLTTLIDDLEQAWELSTVKKIHSDNYKDCLLIHAKIKKEFKYHDAIKRIPLSLLIKGIRSLNMFFINLSDKINAKRTNRTNN